MATLKITALTTFSHGRLNMARGGTETIEAAEARDLENAGLVSIGKADTAPADDDLEDLVGGDKAEAAPKNKMQPAPANKGKK